MQLQYSTSTICIWLPRYNTTGRLQLYWSTEYTSRTTGTVIGHIFYSTGIPGFTRVMSSIGCKVQDPADVRTKLCCIQFLLAVVGQTSPASAISNANEIPTLSQTKNSRTDFLTNYCSTTMMKSLLFLIVLSLNLCFIGATPTPRIPTKMSSQTCARKMSFGGVPRRAFTARGGEVLVAESEDDMQNILLRANGALVVVDYWARYVKGDNNGFCM